MRIYYFSKIYVFWDNIRSFGTSVSSYQSTFHNILEVFGLQKHRSESLGCSKTAALFS